MERSTLINNLSKHPRFRGRIEAIVQADRWENDPSSNLLEPIPIDQLAWAAAAALCPTLDPQAEHNLDQFEVDVQDSVLKPFILDVALPRIDALNNPA